ncbi:hypothetical protein F4677DRAFT_81217 [Hypoxylon crocopeplum]|nr:hypothetical protein F4677DRAFT_81217 [Hypoxylon crocopeplum]
MASHSQVSQSQSPLTEFTLFPSLPPELRIKIWNESLLPRVVVAHWQSITAANGFNKLELVSSCSNPAVLSVCSEARMVARHHFSVRLPIFVSKRDELSSRLLYLNPTSDLLAIIGEIEYTRLVVLFSIIQDLDPAGRGLQRFGLSIGCFAHHFQLGTLQVWDRLSFNQLDEFVLLMYDEPRPPSNFRDGECAVETISGMESFARVFSANTRQLLDADHLRLMNLTFIPGPASRRTISTSE